MNKSQQTILAIIAPIIVIISSYGYISTNIMSTNIWGKETNYPVKWNNFDETWEIWLIAFIIIGAIEITIYTQKIKK